MIFEQHAPRFTECAVAIGEPQRAKIGAAPQASGVHRLRAAGLGIETRTNTTRGLTGIGVLFANRMQQAVKILGIHRVAPFGWTISFHSLRRARCKVTATTICDNPINLATSGLV